jgi:hypothetical protein
VGAGILGAVVRHDLQLVRDALERALAPAVATSVLFEALERSGRGTPTTREETIRLVRGSLAQILVERLGTREGGELIKTLGAKISIDEEIRVDFEDFEDGSTAQMMAVARPVTVLVASAAPAFGERLLVVLGEDRVYPMTVTDEAGLRHATFSAAPLVIVVDATKPPDVKPAALASVLRSLPKQTFALVWSQESDYGRELKQRLGKAALYLDRTEGIEPLLDVILSRYRQGTEPPPAG